MGRIEAKGVCGPWLANAAGKAEAPQVRGGARAGIGRRGRAANSPLAATAVVVSGPLGVDLVYLYLLTARLGLPGVRLGLCVAGRERRE